MAISETKTEAVKILLLIRKLPSALPSPTPSPETHCLWCTPLVANFHVLNKLFGTVRWSFPWISGRWSYPKQWCHLKAYHLQRSRVSDEGKTAVVRLTYCRIWTDVQKQFTRSFCFISSMRYRNAARCIDFFLLRRSSVVSALRFAFTCEQCFTKMRREKNYGV